MNRVEVIEKIRTQSFSYIRVSKDGKMFGVYKFGDGTKGELEEIEQKYQPKVND